MPEIHQERVIEVHHCTDKLFTFKTTRDPSFKFENGQFTMIGLDVGGKRIMRAYSIASPNYEDYLNFISIKVPDGEFTSRLQKIQVGDMIEVSKKTVGSLTIDRLVPGRNLYLLATGTGLAPFMSIIPDPATYERFDHVFVVHCCRTSAELLYADYIRNLGEDKLLGEIVKGHLHYIPTTTQEDSERTGRITTLLETGSIWPIGADDGIMICGNPQMLNDLTDYFTERGWKMGSLDDPGNFIIEKAFAERR
jgi:ferredoxin--NADP+ reductase